MKLTVYSRAYCHLCDDMVAALAALRAEHGFELEVIDVDADPVLEARYNELVPVLQCDGVEVCHHFLDHARLTQVLGSSPAIC
ncbi:MAG: glutaredoxin family protein [Betaproteobacteria bacterium]